MDTRTDAEVAAAIEEIRRYMPDTYASIRRRAEQHGKGVYGQVRRALKGQHDLFYAVERGRVMGAPVRKQGVMAEVAANMVEFGCTYVCIWGEE